MDMDGIKSGKMGGTRRFRERKEKEKNTEQVQSGKTQAVLKKRGRRKRSLYQIYIKRPLDFICALFGIVFLSPVMLITAALIRIKLGSPVIFTQERPGLHEKIFKLYKFRSMSNAKDKDGKLLPDEKRLGSFGRTLRATSLDELPELINILKGDMSVVGPRPLVPQYLHYYSNKERHRHDVRPGLTGLAQINGRNGITWEEKFRYDIQYVKNITLFGDIQILYKTIKTILKHENIGIRGVDSLLDFDLYRKTQIERGNDDESGRRYGSVKGN